MNPIYMANKTVVITSVHDGVNPDKEFMSPTLMDAAGSVANMIMLGVLGGGAVDMPEKATIKVYKIQVDPIMSTDTEFAMLQHTKVRLAEVKIEMVKAAYPGVPLKVEEAEKPVDMTPMVTLQ